MKKFVRSRTFFVLFCLSVWMLLLFGMTTDLSAKPSHYKGYHKVKREYANRAESCRNEQLRIQSSNQTHKVWKNRKSKFFR